MHIVPRIAESEHLKDLLRHPVISTFLISKRDNIRVFFFSDVADYNIFLCILTAYILFHESHNTLNAGSVASNTTDPLCFSDSCVTSGMNDSKAISKQNDPGLDYLWHSATGLWGFII